MAAISIGGDALVGAGTGFFTAGESNVLAGGDCTGGSGLATMVFLGTDAGATGLVGDFFSGGGSGLSVDAPVAWLTMGEGAGACRVVVSLLGDNAARDCLI